MQLFSERPGNRNSDGNLSRETYQFTSVDQMPEIEEGSMFLLLLKQEEAQQNRGPLQQKINAIQIEGQNLMSYVIEGRQPTGWYIQSTLFPNLEGRGLLQVSAYRNRKYTEQIIVICDVLPSITPWFSQGANVLTIYEHFQEGLREQRSHVLKEHDRAASSSE